MFRKKKKSSRLEQVQQSLAGQIQQTSEQVQGLLKRVPEQVHHAGEQVQDVLKQVPLDKVGGRLGEARDGAAQAASRALEALARVKAPPPPPPREDRQAAAAGKLLWLLAGLVAGVVIGLLLAPESGRRTRALLRDKAHKKGHDLADAGAGAAGRAADLGRKAKGMAAQVASRATAEGTVDDGTITDRVRSELGRHPDVHSLPRLNVDTCDGVVTVRGPMADAATQATIERVVRGVPGVTEVRVELLVDEEGAAEAFVG